MSRVHIRLRVGGEHYALPVESVREVADLDAITPVPGAPAAVLGVQNLRGRVLLVIDLASVLGLEGDIEPSCVVIAEDREREAGIAVDSVVNVGALPAPSEETRSKVLAGGSLSDGELVGIVDVAALLEAVASRGAG